MKLSFWQFIGIVWILGIIFTFILRLVMIRKLSEEQLNQTINATNYNNQDFPPTEMIYRIR